MLCGLTFVNLLNSLPSKEDKEDDAPTIRSHAMREVRRRKRILQPISRIDASKNARTTITQKTSSGQAKPYSPSNVGQSRKIVVQHRGPANFHSFSLDTAWHLHYFVHGFTPITFPTTQIHHECDILAIALTVGSAGLLHALCVVSIAHRSLLEQGHSTKDLTQPKIGEPGDVAFLHHKKNAIAWLQKSLSLADATRSKLCQAIIILLLTVESLCGDSLTATTHKRGLMEVATRNKPNSEPRPLMLSDTLMSDIKSAASSSSEPTIRPNVEWVEAFDRLKGVPFKAYRMELEPLGGGFLTFESRKVLGAHLVSILCGMRQLINALERHMDVGKDVSDIDGTYFLVLEHELLSYRSVDERNNASDGIIRRCCRLAALIYCNLCIWKWPKNSTLVRNLCKSLCSALSLWTSTTPLYEHLPPVLWFNFMGAFSASDKHELEWYRKGMTAVSKMLGITTESQLYHALRTFFCADRELTEYIGTCYRAMG